jgi:transposase
VPSRAARGAAWHAGEGRGAGAVGRQACGSEEEEREGRKEERRKERGKKKERKGKKRKEKRKENRKERRKLRKEKGKLEKRKKKEGLGIWEDSRKILEGGENGNFCGVPRFRASA